MAYNKSTSKETVQKTLRIPVEVNERIEMLAEESERDFSKQINFMLKEYLKMFDSFNTQKRADKEAM
jgi:hypothetical protein